MFQNSAVTCCDTFAVTLLELRCDIRPSISLIECGNCLCSSAVAFLSSSGALGQEDEFPSLQTPLFHYGGKLNSSTIRCTYEANLFQSHSTICGPVVTVFGVIFVLFFSEQTPNHRCLEWENMPKRPSSKSLATCDDGSLCLSGVLRFGKDAVL